MEHIIVFVVRFYSHRDICLNMRFVQSVYTGKCMIIAMCLWIDKSTCSRNYFFSSIQDSACYISYGLCNG